MVKALTGILMQREYWRMAATSTADQTESEGCLPVSISGIRETRNALNALARC
jgi:hypothetical protein